MNIERDSTALENSKGGLDKTIEEDAQRLDGLFGLTDTNIKKRVPHLVTFILFGWEVPALSLEDCAYGKAFTTNTITVAGQFSRSLIRVKRTDVKFCRSSVHLSRAAIQGRPRDWVQSARTSQQEGIRTPRKHR